MKKMAYRRRPRFPHLENYIWQFGYCLLMFSFLFFFLYQLGE